MGQHIDGDSDYHNLGRGMSLNSLVTLLFLEYLALVEDIVVEVVKVYRWDGSSWNQVANTINGSRSNDYFGGRLISMVGVTLLSQVVILVTNTGLTVVS